MIRKNFKQSVGMTGQSTLVSNKKKFIDPNTITNVGLSECCYNMLDKSLTQFYFAVGDSDANTDPEEIALQTQLTSEVSRLPPISDRKVEQQLDGSYSFRLLSDFRGSLPELITEPLTEIKEMGMFNRYAKGVMFARSEKSPPLTMDYNAILYGEWIINASVGSVITNGGIVNQGSKLLCESFRKRDNFIDYKNDYYEGETQTQGGFKYPAPYGINLISLGTNSSSTNIGDTDLKDNDISHRDFDTPPTITNLDLTGESTYNNVPDVPDYLPKVIIQKYIPPNTVGIDVHEAGLFNGRWKRESFDSDQSIFFRTMFSRVVLDPFIPANTEAVLTWEITFKRGS